jgi:NhaA family Na+:H+ antiporter
LHATIAGVALGFAVPARPIGGRSLLGLLEGRLHLLSASLVVPLFALANAGVALDAEGFSVAWGSRVAWGVAVGLVVGKLAGVIRASVVAIRLGLGTLPDDMTGRHLWGLGALAGIGFTWPCSSPTWPTARSRASGWTRPRSRSWPHPWWVGCWARSC